ncbi:MAG: type II secretion system protein [Ruminococcus sp.]
MTLSINTMLKNRKNKNKKGFSLVELIVVLVIMAILAAALVPTLIGYINQTRQSNAKNEAAAVVSAAQTVASSAFANGDGKYYDQSNSGNSIMVSTDSKVNGVATPEAMTAIAKLAEINKTDDGAIYSIKFSNGVVSEVKYASGGTNVKYTTDANGKGTYTIESSDFTGTKYDGKVTTPAEE